MAAPRFDYVGRGVAFGGGVLAVAVPCVLLLVAVSGPLDPAWGWARSLLFAVSAVVFVALLGSVMFTTALIRLRHFAWRRFAYEPRTVAAALGAAATLASIGAHLLGDAGVGIGVFVFASLAATLVCKRIVF